MSAIIQSKLRDFSLERVWYTLTEEGKHTKGWSRAATYMVMVLQEKTSNHTSR